MAGLGDHVEEAANELNAADSKLREAMMVYAEQGWTWEDFTDRMKEIMRDEEIQMEGVND